MQYKTLRLVADGCGGQNKNSIMITMCMLYMGKYTPANIETLEMIFPVTGHSFLLADRVFDMIEKEVKRKDMILNPAELLQIIKEFATVINVESDVKIYDFKGSTKSVIKNTNSWPVQISKIKRVIMRRSADSPTLIEVRGEHYYNWDSGNFTSLFTRRATATDIKPDQVPVGNFVKKAKKTDVKNLLEKHFGESWMQDERLSFFIGILNNAAEDHVDENEENVDEPCELRPEPDDLIV